MRFHVLAVPHTITSKDYCACAFTQKVLKMCAMLMRRGHTVYHYGHVDSDVECTENVGVTDNAILKKTYGDYDWKKEFFKHSTDDYAHQTFSMNAIIEVGKRKQPNDFLLCFWSQTMVAVAHMDLIIVEPGIGCFNRLYAPYNVFESYALMNTVYGTMENRIPSWSDCVIPNYFDPTDFEYKETKGDYFLFLSRIIKDKGLKIAVEATKAIGAKLIVAGQGDYEECMGSAPESHVTVVGYADVAKRRKLLSGAKGLILASHYSEPFGGAVIEANMSGTPVITSDWGAFAETVVHGVTGYRCHTMEQFIWAAKSITNGDLSSKSCYNWAMKNYSMDRIVLKYEEYFGTILKARNLDTSQRTELDWLKIYYN